MIDLDEKDIKSIANGRFTRKWRWYLISYLTICVLLIVGFALVLASLGVTEGWIGNLVFIPPMMILVGFGFWSWKLDKAEKKLVKEWKGE